MCNREIKFGVFRQWARDHGFAAVATGHYARRIELTGESTPVLAGAGPDLGARFALLEGADKNKDQSYFLSLLSQEQLAGARFPIGHLPKPELRRLAAEAGLPTAAKKDSQGICFIGEVKMQDFLRQYVPDHPGPIIRATDAQTLGTHRGLHLYTLGQRKGIGVPSNTDHQAYVVVGKRAEDNALLVAFDAADAPGLFQTEVQIHALQWNGPAITKPCRLEGRVRYRDARVAIEFTPLPGNSARVRFDQPQRGLASGQILALHVGERLLGGGVYL
jgi:tRNA-specific 2-thiouridylase